MNHLLIFIPASLALLLTPGPTNTLLAVSGATVGWRASLRLLPAELLGYLISIHVLALAIGPVIQTVPMAQTVMRVACALCLLFLSAKLWSKPALSVPSGEITPARVFLVTLLNPKGLIFAFVIVPYLASGSWLAASPYLAGLCAMIVGVGATWLALGGAIRSGRIAAIGPAVVSRVGAGALTFFALMIVAPLLTR